MESAATFVVKVSYGDVIRRIRMPLKANGELDFNMASLKTIITSLFYLPPDAECFLTYSDEDGDVVALVDDNDLLDVSYQSIKFLRINVQLKSAMPTKPITPESTGSLMPPNSQNLDSTISKVSMDLALKPEAFGYNHDDISKLPKLIITKPRSFESPVTSPRSSGSCFSKALDLAGEKNDISERTQTGPEPANLNELSSFVDSKTSGHVITSSGPISGSTVNNPCPNSIDLKKHDRSVSPSKEITDYQIHKYVKCDGCGVFPITGPRFNSKVEEDYDLCNICFSEMGNEWDYIRMDKPVQNLHEQFIQHSDRLLAQPKLDSLFVLDVDIPEGTVLAPSTKFTKTWRMKNNGSFVWPHGTKMVWDGGDCLNNFSSVDLQIPEEGVGINSEFDVKVDFVAPKSPGGCISYWRMASPLGALFGQRVWVIIHVDASLEDSESAQPESSNVNLATVEGAEVEREFEKSQVGEKKMIMFGKLLLPLASPHSHSPSSSPSSFHSFEMGDFSSVSTFGDLSGGGSSTKDIPKDEEHNDVEISMLKELEEMGFKETDINKKILRDNEYNLEKSVDALCEVSEWDHCEHILDELHKILRL